MSVTVFLAKAIICFLGTCHPVVIGESTQPGDYMVQQRFVLDPMYGGDVLQYNETETSIQAIHRSISLRRDRLLENSSALQRRTVSKGCINVQPGVYNELVNCATCRTLRILE